MLDSTLNTENLRNAFKCAAPQFGLNGMAMHQPVEGAPHATQYQPKTHQQKPHTTGSRPQFMRGLDRGH